MTKDTEEVFGRPVTGEISRGYEQPQEQMPDEEFLEALDTLLAHPEVEAVRWNQSVPYFNDGDPCVFSANSYSAEIKLTWLEDDDEFDDHEGWVGSEDGDLDLRGDFRRDDWNRETGGDYRRYDDYWTGTLRGRDVGELREVLNAFSKKLDGAHDVLLQKTFGDHAVVTATPAGFNVEYYEHD